MLSPATRPAISHLRYVRRPQNLERRWLSIFDQSTYDLTHIDLRQRQLPVRIDSLSATNSQLLDTTFADTGLLPSGHLLGSNYLAYFPPLTTESDLLEDGTDTYHAPDRSYKYRLWTGGSLGVNFSKQQKRIIGSFEKFALVEKIGRIRPRSDGSKVHVQIHRVVVPAFRHWHAEIRRLEEARDQDELLEASRVLTDLVFKKSDDPGMTTACCPIPQLLLHEKRWIIFSREKPEVREDPGRPAPSADVFLRRELTTTRSMLFRFSALTWNAHAIHIDPEYTKSEYGLPGLLVHGPMTLHMLHCHAREVAARYSQGKLAQLGFKSPIAVSVVRYANKAPIFVEEPIEIGCTAPVPAVRDPNILQATMWIAKRGGDGRLWRCVEATVDFVPGPSEDYPEPSASYRRPGTEYSSKQSERPENQ